MRTLIFFIIYGFYSSLALAQDDLQEFYEEQKRKLLREGCVTYGVEEGDNCNSSSSVRVDIKNQCGTDVRVWICIREATGSWDCGLHSIVSAGESASNFVCDAARKLPSLPNVDVSFCLASGKCKSPQ